MNHAKLPHANALALRQLAEASVACATAPTGSSGEPQSGESVRQLVHELQVHQIELEMQNEQLRNAHLELDNARARYFDLFDLAPVGYCTVNAQGEILEANFTAAKMLNTSRNELVKRPLTRFIVRADQDTYYRCSQTLLHSGLPQECELQMQQREGPAIWVHLKTCAAHDMRGEAIQRMTWTDISARKHSEALLQDKAAELAAAQAVAEWARQAKSDFLLNMTHELRSPLNAILGFAQLLDMSNPPPSAKQKNNIDQIQQAGWHLLDLVGEILDLTAIESDQVALSPQSVALTKVLQECHAMVDARALKAGITLHFVPPALAYHVSADRSRLKQVLVHLLSNAIQYNRPGGSVEVTCSQPTQQRVRVSVRDTGDGLSSEKLALLFQPFNRLGRETHAEAGVGVGLAVSKRLVELMGASIGALSTEGLGCVFWIELNLQKETK